MRIWALDIGNKRAKLACFQNDIIIGEVISDSTKRWRELLKNVERQNIIAVCSVVPEAGRGLHKWANENDVSLWFLNADNAHITIDYTPKGSLGEDRIAAAIGAIKLFPNEKHIVVVDAGSAITCDLIDISERKFEGGAILAGLPYLTKFAQMSERLASAKVEAIEMLSPPGHSTEESLKAGLAAQTAFAVEALRRQYARTKGRNKISGVITGGDAPKMLPYLPNDWTMATELVLRGLYEACSQYIGKEKILGRTGAF